MFHNRVERIPIDDHNVPRLRLESDASQVVSLSISLYWRVTCDGKEEARERERERESSSLLPSHHPCFCHACYARRRLGRSQG